MEIKYEHKIVNSQMLHKDSKQQLKKNSCSQISSQMFRCSSQMFWSLFLTKKKSATLLKTDSNRGVFL